MAIQLSMWNVHTWCSLHNIEHFYSIEEDVNVFSGIRIQSDTVYPECAVLSDEPGNSQYRSVLSYGRDRIYFLHENARSIFKTLNDMISSYLACQRKMVRACVRREPLDALLQAGSLILTFPVLILCRGQILAASEGARGNADSLIQSVQAGSIGEFAALSDQIARAEASGENDGLPLLVPSPFSSDTSLIIDHMEVHDSLFWILASDGKRKLVYGDIFHVRMLKEALMQYLSLSESECDPSESDHRISGSAQSFDKSDSCFAVFRIESAAGKPSLLTERIFSEIRKRRPKDRLDFSGSGLLLISGAASEDELPDRAFFDSFLPKGHYYIGASWHYPDLSKLPVMVRQACRSSASARQKAVPYVSIRDISAQLVRSVLYETPQIAACVHPLIRHLDDLDREGGGSFPYLKTLSAFLAHGGNFYAAARELSINRNTLVHRIRRIEDLGGCSLQDPEFCEVLHLSLLIYSGRPESV